MGQYVKTAEAPPHYKPDLEPGDAFEEDLDESTERAVLCAGWVARATADKKKGDK